MDGPHTRTDLRLTWQSQGGRPSIEDLVDDAESGGRDLIATRVLGSALLGQPAVTAYAPPRTGGVRVAVAW